MNVSKKTTEQREKLRAEILKKLAKGGIRQTTLIRMFPGSNSETVRSVVNEMHQLGQLRIEEVDGWELVSLPITIEKVPKELKIEPRLPRVEPILPRIEPLKRDSGVFVQDSPERLILQTLEDGARMRENLVRLVAGQISSDEANKLLNRMIKSGVISETRGGRLSLAQK
jgi:DNA-binding TFAR19-related protein (PDSD5 family)